MNIQDNAAMAANLGTPVEFVWEANPAAPVRIERAGHDLSFPSDSRYLTEDGRPRRIEWISDPALVELLTGPLYNQPGGPVCFAVAQDLLRASRTEMFRRQVLSVLEGNVMPPEERQQLLHNVRQAEAAAEALGAVMDGLVERIDKLEETVANLRQSRPRGRPRTPSADATPSAEVSA